MTRDPVETYLTQLTRAVGCGGPPSVFTEVRDHLTDATEHLRISRGLTVWEAQAQAVEDFGSVEQVAPLYRETLAVRMSRRATAALLITLLINVIGWRMIVGPAVPDSSPLTGLILTLQMLAWAGVALCAFSLIASRWAARRGTSPTRWSRASNTLTITCCVTVIGLAALHEHLRARPRQRRHHRRTGDRALRECRHAGVAVASPGLHPVRWC